MHGAHITPAPVRPPMDVSTATDLCLAEQAAHAGRMLEVAYQAGDRELALIWQQAMFAVVNLRRVRRFGLDTQSPAGCTE